uniref:uncharacterized protein si:ch211-188c16.1 isoform X1 n=1 Tax=Gasterosteus aculeatus aculeatus TaxID=481459 RepID=UPI001A997D08|nr:uncharacterized protein si:ch211-188c16.1 isoform X1 [Gasterosteus aculeatus aculeatus]
MEEGLSNFKALRAKFQEEALLARSKASRPAVSEKPKRFSPPGGHCCSVVSGINVALENHPPVVPRVIFRDDLRASGGRRPISFPPRPQQTSPPSPPGNGDATTRQSLRDRHMPLVLPVLPVKERKTELPAQKEHKGEPEPWREVPPQTKIKKKPLLLPFKSAKVSKVSAQNGEGPTYADLTTRPCSAPGEFPSVERQTAEGGVLLRGEQSPEFPVADIPITPPPAETSGDSNNKFVSTLERAKKRFSSRQVPTAAKPKNWRCPDFAPRDGGLHSLPGGVGEPELPVPSPLHCLSARPFSKVNPSAHRSAWDKQFARDKSHPPVRAGKPRSPSAPRERPLPDWRSLGPQPPKPPRPPSVDVTCYLRHTLRVSPGLRAPNEEPKAVPPSVSHYVLDAPEFPDFENSQMETTQSEAFDIASLELEAFDLVSTDLPVPEDRRLICFKEADSPVCDPPEPHFTTGIRDLNLGSQRILPLDPASFPEPINFSAFPQLAASERWAQREEVIVDPLSSTQADESDAGDAESHSATQETDSGSHTGLNDVIQSHASVSRQDSYNDAWNNVYEDVDNVNKLFSGQNSRKLKGSLKNPYAHNHPTKEEACLHIWPRNPWGTVSGEHAQLVHNYVHSQGRQSPNNADLKEQRKREKQRLEKDKKVQKEREKKENEMKKKFKVTGEEEAMYHAKVIAASKVRKHDLPVQSGDTVSIIRTTSCPKGRWLARDANHKYGYISVMNVELNIKEMLELGKKAQAAGRGGNPEGDTISIGSRSSAQPVLTSSFTDDSEEWACEDETLSPSSESHSYPHQTASLPEMSCGHVSAPQTLSDANLEDLHTQTRHEALQKLAIFFQHSREESDDIPATPANAKKSDFLCGVEEPPLPEQKVDFPEVELLPPPPLYADAF